MAESSLKPTFHHMDRAQSQRILWLLEELGIPYELKLHERQKSGPRKTRSPPELFETHPLGKAPLLETGDGRVISESSAIAKYLIETYDTAGKFKGSGKSNDAIRDEELSSLGGTSIGPMMFQEMFLDILTKQMPFFIRPLVSGLHGYVRKAFLGPELSALFNYLNDQLGEQEYFMGTSPGRADFLLSWNFDFCTQRGYVDVKKYPNLDRWYTRCHERPAWKASLSKGNGYNLADLGS